MKNLTRAQRKKAQRQFKPGDVVTWGSGEVSHRVVSVNPRGVVVDVTSCIANDCDVGLWAARQRDGRFHLLVIFDGNLQGSSPGCRFKRRGTTRGPVRLSTSLPDVFPVKG